MGAIVNQSGKVIDNPSLPLLVKDPLISYDYEEGDRKSVV